MIKTVGPYITTPLHWTCIHGFFDYEDIYRAFVDRCVDGDVIVEIGCYLGRSACFLGEIIQTSGKKITVLAVDTWPATYVFQDNSGIVTEAPFETFYANVRQSGLLDIIVPIRASSLWAATFVRDNLACVFIDGEHNYPNPLDDIKAWLPKVRHGGILAGHDYEDANFSGVVRAVKESFGTNYKVFNRSWAVEVP